MKPISIGLIVVFYLLESGLSSSSNPISYKNIFNIKTPLGIQPIEIYVSVSGNDESGKGTMGNPFRTIQKAINNSQNGDVVIVLPGRYTGYGNTNLDPEGKKIEIRSQDPLDSACLNNTIIDAEGKGLIIRFLKNEGKGTIFNGFSLICGDTNIHIMKGVPGFFEFSEKALPEIKNIKIAAENKKEAENPFSKIESKGTDCYIDPFLSPVKTTDYYGSGDVDKDGKVDQNDINAIDQIIKKKSPPNIRCDIDGNSIIDENDAGLLLSYIKDNVPLPSFWDGISDRTKKNIWIDKMLSIDKTNENIYSKYYYVCDDFSKELYIHFRYILSDLFDPGLYPLNVVFNGGQTIYNLPIYYVDISSRGFSHRINAILVGDNPLSFNDWRFIEPQNDATVIPGSWDMPFTSNVSIWFFENPSAEVVDSKRVIDFYVDEQGTTLQYYDTCLLMAKSPSASFDPINTDYQWYPEIILSDSTFVLYEQTRDDMSRISDIHIRNNDGKSKPITLLSENSFLLDSYQESDSVVHLLFTSRLTKYPGVYYGKYSLKTNILSDTKRISSSSSRIASSGKLIVSGDQVYAFWFVNYFTHSGEMPSPGYYWNKSDSDNWGSEALLYSVHETAYNLISNGPSSFPYTMDAVLLNNGNVLVAVQSLERDYFKDIVFLHYNGAIWTSTKLDKPIEHVHAIRDLDLVYDSKNVLHLIYTNPGKYTYPPVNTGIHPSLCYQNSKDDGNNWSDVRIIEYSDKNSERIYCNPQLIFDNNRLLLTYLNMEQPSRIFYRFFENNLWQSPDSIILSDGSYAYFPQVRYLNPGNLLFVWSNSSIGKVELRDTIIGCGFSKPGIISGDISICLGQESSTYIVPEIANATYYTWSLPNGSIGFSKSNSITVTYSDSATSGKISVKGENTCGISPLSTLPVSINKKPVTPVITQKDNILYSDASMGNQWFDDNGLIINATDQTYTVTLSGNYYVIVTHSGCMSDASEKVTVNITGVRQDKDVSIINVYPNPVINELIIEMTGNNKPVNFEIFNSSGEIIFRDTMIEKYTVQTRIMIPGLYIIKFDNGKTLEFRKIIKD